ncbi:MAG TPA: alpha/beta hydrolase-fold protein [Bacteroidales bacterium]|nr:alpha/beta hydrolase-fold protein [Bacteroidales bacterium]HQJ21471.1 alpha/beta hydrolase-fold protein [Bacteroidales bacterium]HRC89573.1 alpha/beta hydrolase-fold protein [Bacteroidales bacterium]
MKNKSLFLNLFICTTLVLIMFQSNIMAQERREAPAARPAFRMPARVVSPEILPDNRVILRLYARDAASVSVSGEWQTGLGAGETLARNDTGLFSITIGPLKPELYGYSFIVDGVRTIDPNNVQVRRDGSRYENFFIIPGPESDLYIQKHGVPHGTVSKVWYKSSVLEMDRRLYVYTPAGYETGKTRYPVFYLLHGAGGDEDAWTNMGRAAQIMDNLIAQGRAKPMIVVMTNGNANQAGAQNEVPPLQTQPGQGPEAFTRYAGKFEEHLVKDVVPFIEKNYRTLKGKDNRAIAGLSMGGAHTQTITNDNPGMFSYIGVFSMGLMNPGSRNQDVSALEKERDAKIEALKNSGYKLYWIGCGKDDFVYQSVINLRNFLDKHNFKYIYRESTGGHTWANWRIYLSEFAPLLFK